MSSSAPPDPTMGLACQPVPKAKILDPERLAALDALGILDTPPSPTFDDIAAIVGEVCDAPIALVSLIDRERQWFKARLNFLPTQTTLDQSICAHTLLGPDLLVIPNLTQDPRTAANPLVTGPEALRFYAGAPLVTPDGYPLGALCVIDTVPRPEGLSPKQAGILTKLARQVVSQLEMQRVLVQRDDLVGHLRVARDEAADERRRLALLFDNAPSFVALQWGPDHVFQRVNAAYKELIGGRNVIGHRVADILPDAAEQGFVAILDEVFRTGVPYEVTSAKWVSMANPEAPVERILDFTYQPVREDGRVVGIFTVGHDVTDRARQVRRQGALAALGERLREVSDPEEVTRVAAHTVAEALDAARAGIGTVDTDAETVLMHPNWCAPGVAPVEGLFRFRDFGSYIDDLKAGRSVAIGDVRTDRRTADGADALASIGIQALVNFPILDRGRFVLVAFAHFPYRRDLSADDTAFIEQVAERTQAALQRLRLEEQQRALNGELAHRMKNALAMVQAIVTQTLRQARSTDEARIAVGQRMTALGRAQDILTRSSWEEADIRDVVAAAIAPHAGDGTRLSFAGPFGLLNAQQALGLSLALHELATNAAKYGALSNETGRVAMTWRNGEDGFRFEWIESGGPPVIQPERRGFGSRLIERTVAGYFDGEAQIAFDPGGVRFTLQGRDRLADRERQVRIDTHHP